MNPSPASWNRLASAALVAALLGLAPFSASGAGRTPDETHRNGLAIRQLSDGDLKAFYLRCTHAALQQALGGAEAALCSVAYELLLRRTFRGDFFELIAWSRSQAENADETASLSMRR